MRYLLDTNVVSEVIRNPRGQVTQRIREVGEAQVCSRIIVAAALLFGAALRYATFQGLGRNGVGRP